MNENSRVEKRPRYMTGKGAPGSTIGSTLARRPALGERRAALGERRAALTDVTNRISVRCYCRSRSVSTVWNTTNTSLSTVSQVKKSSTTHSLGTSGALAKKKLLAKRALATHSLRDLPLTTTTPVVSTLGSLGLADKTPAKREEPKSETSELDIDSADKRDPAQCWQYAEDITKYHLSVEVRAVSALISVCIKR